MERHPEEYHHREHQTEGYYAVVCLRRRQLLLCLDSLTRLCHTAFYMSERRTEYVINSYRQYKRGARYGKREMIGIVRGKAD